MAGLSTGGGLNLERKINCEIPVVDPIAHTRVGGPKGRSHPYNVIRTSEEGAVPVYQSGSETLQGMYRQ